MPRSAHAHIEDFVSLEVEIGPPDRRPKVLVSGVQYYAVKLLYVDPRTGILRLTKRKKRRARG